MTNRWCEILWLCIGCNQWSELHRLSSILKYTSSGRLDLICNHVVLVVSNGRQTKPHKTRILTVSLLTLRARSCTFAECVLRPEIAKQAAMEEWRATKLYIAKTERKRPNNSTGRVWEQPIWRPIDGNRRRRQNIVVTIDWSSFARYQSITIN